MNVKETACTSSKRTVCKYKDDFIKVVEDCDKLIKTLHDKNINFIFINPTCREFIELNKIR